MVDVRVPIVELEQRQFPASSLALRDRGSAVAACRCGNGRNREPRGAVIELKVLAKGERGIRIHGGLLVTRARSERANARAAAIAKTKADSHRPSRQRVLRHETDHLIRSMVHSLRFTGAAERLKMQCGRKRHGDQLWRLNSRVELVEVRHSALKQRQSMLRAWTAHAKIAVLAVCCLPRGQSLVLGSLALDQCCNHPAGGSVPREEMVASKISIEEFAPGRTGTGPQTAATLPPANPDIQSCHISARTRALSQQLQI